MKTFLSTVAAALLLTTLQPACAAEARTLPEALNKAGQNPVVVFIYGANYDKLSQKKYDEFVGQRKINPALHRCVFLAMPVYQLPDEKQQEEMKRMMGDKKLPSGIWSYPCLAVLDSENNLRGIVQKPEEMETPEAASAALKRILDDFRDQQKLLAKADRARGARKAQLLFRAAEINLALPESDTKDAKDNKRDKVGFANRVKFDPLAVVEKIQTMDFETANAYIRSEMVHSCYSRQQRQMMLAALAGHLRRAGASKSRQRALYTEMRNIDPASSTVPTQRVPLPSGPRKRLPWTIPPRFQHPLGNRPHGGQHQHLRRIRSHPPAQAGRRRQDQHRGAPHRLG